MAIDYESLKLLTERLLEKMKADPAGTRVQRETLANTLVDLFKQFEAADIGPKADASGKTDAAPEPTRGDDEE